LEPVEVDRLLMKPTKQRRVGKYVLLGRLGHGGMGKIYLAFQPGPGGLERLLVVKRLHSHLRKDKKLVASFLDEARLSMALNHPNVVHTYDVGEERDRTYMVLEFIDGQNLGVVLRTAKRQGNYPDPAFWAFIMMGALDGLHHAHTAKDARGRSLNVIHRDISPQNILLSYDGVTKLVDFGIAKAAMRLNETDAGVLKGKYAYMSPEQVRGEPLDARSDLFAAGVVLWEAFCGRRLYKCDSIVESAERITNEPPISPLELNPDCPPELAAVVVKALQKDPADRFQSAEDMRDALDEAVRATGARIKRKDVRELLDALFGGVREQQQNLLERCLNLASDDGRVETPPPGEEPFTYDEESGSDFQVPSLNLQPHVETTHPSASMPALATREDDSDLPPTREDGPSTPKKVPPRKEGPGVMASLLVEPDNADAPETPSQVQPAPLANTPVEPSSSSATPKIAAAVALLLVLLGIGWWTSSTPTSADPQPPAAETATAPPNKPVASPTVEAPPEAQPKAQPTAKPVKTTQRPRRTPKKPVRRAPKPAKPKATRQTLTLDTRPYTEVYMGSKHLGTTPIVNVPVPAGRLRLRLKNAKEGIDQPYEVTIPKGEDVRKRLGLK